MPSGPVYHIFALPDRNGPNYAVGAVSLIRSRTVLILESESEGVGG